MIIGIGLDLCDVKRMEPMLSSERFLQKYFTAAEQSYILGKKACAAQSLAGHFAAKEAGLKALQCGIAHPLHEIEVMHGDLGAPFLKLRGGAMERMLRLGGKAMRLSITHTNETAAAVAILEGDGPPAKNTCWPFRAAPFRQEKEALLKRILSNRYSYTVFTDDDANQILPERPFDAYKGSCGHALVVAGSFGMAGAAALCMNAALRGGAGLVTAACPPEIISILQTLAPCAMCVPIEDLRQALQNKSAVAAGPGLQPASLDQALEALLEASLPQVWDAEALNWLSRHPAKLSSSYILTPHYGEAARLLGVPTDKVINDPAEAALQLHARYGAVVLLKGPVTLIADDGALSINLTGSPGMATGGSGDVLTGLIAAFLAQGIPPRDAARLSAFLHGKAGEAAADLLGVRSMTAQDILHALRIE